MVHWKLSGIRKGSFHELAHRRLAAFQDGRQNARGALPGLGAVDMRVGQIDRHAVAVFGHRLGQIDVIVEADHHRNFRSDDGADPAQQFSFAILEIFTHHRAVQIEIDRIDRHRQRQPADQLACDPLIGVAGDDAAGPAAGP